MSIRIIVTTALATVLLSHVALADSRVNVSGLNQRGPTYVPGTLTQRSPCPVCSFKAPTLIRR